MLTSEQWITGSPRATPLMYDGNRIFDTAKTITQTTENSLKHGAALLQLMIASTMRRQQPAKLAR
jgi:hypothetical protein